METYRFATVKELYEQRGLKPRSATNLVDKGVIVPVKVPENQGGRKEYSYRNLIESMTCSELLIYQAPHSIMSAILNSDSVKSAFDDAEHNRGKTGYKFIIKYSRAVKLWTKKRLYPNAKEGELQEIVGTGIEAIPTNKFKFDMKKHASCLLINVGELKDYVDITLGQ